MIKPLNPSLAAIWEHEDSDYPDLIKVPMEGGKVITYRREIQQPEPMLLKSIDLIQSMNATIYGGYKYKEKHAKKEAGAAGTASDQGTGRLIKDHYTTGVSKSE